MSRYLHIIYCDDVRLEAGNKQSLMGIYTNEMWVPAFPVVLPKLCIVASLITPIDEPFKKVIIKITKDNETLIEAPLMGDQLHQPQLNIIENGDKGNVHRRIGLNGTFILSPFQVENECTLRVRAETENGELIGGGLTIKAGQPSSDGLI